jgi:hypothetical protein
MQPPPRLPPNDDNCTPPGRLGFEQLLQLAASWSCSKGRPTDIAGLDRSSALGERRNAGVLESHFEANPDRVIPHIHRHSTGGVARAAKETG